MEGEQPPESSPPVSDDANVLRATADEARADEWSLVLSSMGIEHLRDQAAGGHRLLVGAAERAAAEEALAAYEVDRRDGPAPLEQTPDFGATRVGIAAGVFLLGAFLLDGPRGLALPWMARGAANAERILSGELWRVVTALTLHADAAHVAGNALALAVLLTAVARWIGPARATALTLATGAIGNLLTALVHRAQFISVGASTATFGAMGLLAGLQLTRRGGFRRGVAVGGASLALLGMLGVGERADVFAHLFGLLTGAGLGLTVGARRPRPPRRSALQPVLATLPLLAIAGCWLLALR